MRKLRILFFFAIVLIVVSCTKEGPEGPVGATGPQGPAGNTGAQGTAGTNGTNGINGINANVIYSSWYTTVAADWTAGGGPPYWDIYKYIRAAPGITQAIIDNGVVLSYMKDWLYDSDGTGAVALHSPTTVQLPYFGDVFYTDFWDFALTAPGSIRYMYKSNAAWLISVMPGVSYRYIIIPGLVSGGRYANGTAATYNGYTKDQLKSMTYTEVAKLFNIPEAGSNE